MSGSHPVGFPARTQQDVVLALPSRSGSTVRRESQASVVGPARETPPSSPEQYAQEDGQNNVWEQSPGYDVWDQIDAEQSTGRGRWDAVGAEPTQEDDWAYTSPEVAYTPVRLTTPLYTPAASYSSPYSPVTPPEYRPPPPATYQELLERTEGILRDSQMISEAVYELHYNAGQLAQVLRNRGTNDWEAGPSASAGVRRRHGNQRTDDSRGHSDTRRSQSGARRSHSRSRGD